MKMKSAIGRSAKDYSLITARSVSLVFRIDAHKESLMIICSGDLMGMKCMRAGINIHAHTQVGHFRVLKYLSEGWVHERV